MTPINQASRLLVKLAKNLFADSAEREKFVAALTDPKPPPPHLVWLKPKPEGFPWSQVTSQKSQATSRLSSPFEIDVLPVDAQPGREKLHEEGFYYCMDPSSIAAVSVVSGIPLSLEGRGQGEGGVLIDLCSSPGGKGILAWHRFKPSLSVFNEVSRKRISPLIYNLKRCGISKSVVTQMDPQKLSEKIPSSASLVLVDAPCTGQSLLARGESAPGCFHPVLIKKCSGRQRRIIACAGGLVAPGGYLAYMTCAFSREENEAVVEWFLEKNPQFAPVPVPQIDSFQSHLSEIPCYRFWPHRGLASGSFTVLLQKTREGSSGDLDLESLRTVWRRSA